MFFVNSPPSDNGDQTVGQYQKWSEAKTAVANELKSLERTSIQKKKQKSWFGILPGHCRRSRKRIESEQNQEIQTANNFF